MLENIIWKKVVYTIKFYLQFLCVAGYLKHSNNNIHNSNDKYTNYNIIEIYINRLSTTTEIFRVMDYLIMMSKKYLYFRKRKRTFGKDIFTNSIELTGSMYFGNIYRIMFLPKICSDVFTKDMYKNLKEIGIIQDVSKLVIFVNLWVFKLHSSLH